MSPSLWAVPAVPHGVRAWRVRSDRPAPAGSGRRAVRHLARLRPCCKNPQPQPLDDGRSRCVGCGSFWSASHSGSLIAVVRAPGPIGVDVQQPRSRPAALRRWGDRCGVPGARLSHWVLGEACLKAVGLAQSLPRRGELNLPTAPKDSGRTMLADGRAIAWRWGDAAGDPDGCFWALAWLLGSFSAPA